MNYKKEILSLLKSNGGSMFLDDIHDHFNRLLLGRIDSKRVRKNVIDSIVKMGVKDDISCKMSNKRVFVELK